MRIILITHSILIWLVLLSGAAAAITILLSRGHRAISTSLKRTLVLAFVGSIDLQALLGMATFLHNGAVLPTRVNVLPHAGLMFLALLSAHAASHWSKRAGHENRPLVAIAISMALVSTQM